MASCPIAGVIWQHLHYIVGLQRMGHEVYYVEDSARYPYNPVNFETADNCGYAVATLRELAKTYGFNGRWAYCARFLNPPQSFGLKLQRLRELYREADVVLNVCGSNELNEDLARSEHLIYVETDPGFEQIKIDQGDDRTIHYLRRHRVLFTFGENVGKSMFPVPLHGFHWLPTRQPIVMDFWRVDSAPSAGSIFTTIANWSTRGRKDFEWNGEAYLWSKAENFLQYTDVPIMTGEAIEIAADIRDVSTAKRLRAAGWHLKDPHVLSIDREAYRGYIRCSRGEFTVAKDQYVRLNTGWFSDRSACYLAAGRPVITQETGFTRLFGGEKGLLSFSNVDEVGEAVAAIRGDYATHARAAFEIAVEFFDAGKVLTSLLDRAGV